MTVYYRNHDLLITHEVFQVWFPCLRSFPIRELHSVRVVEGAQRPRIPGALWLVPAVLAAMAVLLPVVRASAKLTIVMAVLAAAAAVRAGCVRDTASPYVLLAVHRGREVHLFDSTDAQKFWQVKRALQRAIERYEEF